MDWSVLESHLRTKVVSIEFVESLLDWDWKQYENLPDILCSWTCPGCNFSFEGISWKEERKKHKKECRYYNLCPNRQYEHMTSRCACCIYNYHDNVSHPVKRKATRVTILYFIYVEKNEKQEYFLSNTTLIFSNYLIFFSFCMYFF